MSFKSFTAWMEEKKYSRQVKHMLLRKLGADPHAGDPDKDPIKLDDIWSIEQIKTAIESLPGLDDDKIAELQTWLDNTEGPTLQSLLAQIGDEVQVPTDNLPGKPAQLPQGTPKPQPQPQQPPAQPQQMPPGPGPDNFG